MGTAVTHEQSFVMQASWEGMCVEAESPSCLLRQETGPAGASMGYGHRKNEKVEVCHTSLQG